MFLVFQILHFLCKIRFFRSYSASSEAEARPRKGIESTSTGNNLAKSQSIFKQLERFEIAFKFPII